MYDTPKVLLGLVIFFVLITFPIWYNTAGGTADYVPVLEKAVKGTTCVADTTYMKTSHMDLLNQWRDEVVRYNQRVYVAPDGTEYNKSLTHTCLDCHADKEQFCDKCHNYLKVDPYCWDCHVVPNKEMK